jgi:spore coat protein H
MANRFSSPNNARRWNGFRPLRDDGQGARAARAGSAFAVGILGMAIVQIAGCASDPGPQRLDGGADSGATIQNPCGTVDIGLQTMNATQLFGMAKVPTFDLYLPAADWQALKAHARDEIFVPAQACFEGRAIGTIGLRFKGSYGTLYNCFNDVGEMTCPRLSMKMKFDKYDDSLRFHGLKRLNFNACRFDDSRMKEKLAYDVYRSMGIVAPRSAWAVLRVNGETQGLFGMVEEVDGRFTTAHWPDNPDGNLYKELWPTHASTGQIASALETNTEVADISGYQAFAQAIMLAEETSVLTTLGEYVDLDYFARFMAVDDALANYDSITYFWTDGVTTNNHNFFFYEESPRRFTLVPWDAESTFWIDPAHAAPHWTEIPADCSLTYAYWDGLATAPGCDRVFRAMVTDLGPWRAAARQLLDGPFALDAMTAAIDRHAALIGEAARSDPTPTVYATFDQAVANLRSTIPAMRARLEQLIAN